MLHSFVYSILTRPLPDFLRPPQQQQQQQQQQQHVSAKSSNKQAKTATAIHQGSKLWKDDIQLNLTSLAPEDGVRI